MDMAPSVAATAAAELQEVRARAASASSGAVAGVPVDVIDAVRSPVPASTRVVPAAMVAAPEVTGDAAGAATYAAPT